MRTTLNLDDELLEQARKCTGVQEKTQLLHLGLQALIELGGHLPNGSGVSQKTKRKVSLPIFRVPKEHWLDAETLAARIAKADLEADRAKFL